MDRFDVGLVDHRRRGTLDDDAGDRAGAERHDDARADRRGVMPSGDAVGQEIKSGNGDGDADVQGARCATAEPSRVLTSFHVFPHLALGGWIAQQVRGMERGDQLGAAVVVDAAAQAGNRIERAQQRLRREFAERHDHLGLDEVDLPEQKRLARRDLVGLRIAVLGRPAFDDVGDVHVVARQADGLDDLREELAGAADERDALDVFVRARRLADKHQVRLGLPTPNTIV